MVEGEVPDPRAAPSWSHKVVTFAGELLELARSREIRLNTLQATLQDVARLSGAALDVRRTSVWRLRDDQLECTVLVEDGALAPAERLSGMRLLASSCPEYFARLHERQSVVIEDARDDPLCRGMRGYLDAHGVGALLDVPLVAAGELLGVVCHEHVGGARRWTPDEVGFCDVLAAVVIAQLEIARRMRAEVRAEQTEARYVHLVESLPVVVYAFDIRTGSLDYLGPNIAEISGLTTEQWLARGGVRAWVSCIEAADRPPVLARFQDPASEEFDPDVSYRIRFPNGTRRFVRDRCSIVRDHHGRPISLHGMLADVTAEHEAQLLTHEHARRLQELLANSELSAVSLDLDGTVRSVNDALAQTVGRSADELVGADWFRTVVSPAEQARALASYREDVSRGRITARREVAIVTASGEERRVVWASTALRRADQQLEGVMWVGVDMTERDRQLAGQYHAQRLESLGQLAAGMAHDFNNLLQVIGTTASELRELAGVSGAEALDDHDVAVDQARKLVRSLLAFARREAPSAGTSVIDDEVGSALPLLSRLARAHKAPIVELGAPMARVAIDGVHLQQVLLNLVSNAAHAMEGRSGNISIITARATPDPSRGLDPNTPMACLSVRDQGVGIAPQLLETIFEPFYTSKADRGTGLGLATVRAIVERAGGFISVESVIGEGSTFRLWLPIVG